MVVLQDLTCRISTQKRGEHSDTGWWHSVLIL